MYHFRIKDTWEVMSSSSAGLISKQNAVSDSLMWPHVLKWDTHLSLSLHLLDCFTARHLLKSRWLSIDNKNLPTHFCQKYQLDFWGKPQASCSFGNFDKALYDEVNDFIWCHFEKSEALQETYSLTMTFIKHSVVISNYPIVYEELLPGWPNQSNQFYTCWW